MHRTPVLPSRAEVLDAACIPGLPWEIAGSEAPQASTPMGGGGDLEQEEHCSPGPAAPHPKRHNKNVADPAIPLF